MRIKLRHSTALPGDFQFININTIEELLELSGKDERLLTVTPEIRWLNNGKLVIEEPCIEIDNTENTME